jgi:DGQHR domain-containing protein
MKVIAHRINHGDKELFFCALPGAILADESRVKVDINSPSNKDGYQREPTPTRFREIGDYVAGESEVAQAMGPVMSQSLVLNSRKPLFPRPLELDGLVELDLDDDYVLWEVDGQHRIGGIRDAISRDNAIEARRFPVVILNGFQRFDEAVHFWLINDTQKRVPVDVAQRVIAQWSQNQALNTLVKAQGKSWVRLALEVVDIINETEAQPWYLKIKVPGTKKTKGRMISQNAFANSLKRLFQTAPYSDLSAPDLAKLVIRYWRAIERTIPQAFEDPKKFVLQKTTGVDVLNRLMPMVFERVRTKAGRVSEEGLDEVLRVLLSDGAMFWHGKGDGAAKYGTSNKGLNLLLDYLERERMPKVQPTGIL